MFGWGNHFADAGEKRKINKLDNRCRNFVRRTDGANGRGGSKKRNPDCNDQHKGSTLALTWKGAELLLVFHGKKRRYNCECTKFNDAKLREA